jgi:hypothetical protein
VQVQPIIYQSTEINVLPVNIGEATAIFSTGVTLINLVKQPENAMIDFLKDFSNRGQFFDGTIGKGSFGHGKIWEQWTG